MDTKLSVQQPSRNDFSFMGLTENFIEEKPDYITIYDFEKLDYVPYYMILSNNLYRFYAVAVVYIVGIWGLQKWMKNREPFELRRPLFVWNVFLAGLSMIMFSRFLPEVLYINQKYGFYRSYCNIDHANVATIFWMCIYSISKIFEFVDTVFIVLRKQKLTFLHTFHHTSIYIACVFGLLRADPAARYFVLMNTFVHSVMYSYWALKSANFKLSRKLSMAVTTVQLVQFAVGSVINLLVVYAKVMGTEPHCERPNDISFFYGVLGAFYFYIFGRFFVQSYLMKKKNTLKEKST